MANSITLDGSDFLKGLAKFDNKFMAQKIKAMRRIANELLRLSQKEVPHDTGALQNTGHVEEKGDEVIVGYNKVYAARLHENPQYRFQKGRKGKYLEDPLKNNESVFNEFLNKEMQEAFKQ